jgi:hypothetical protein
VNDAVARRAAELRAELQKGREQLARLDARRAEVRDTLLRIAGALQVLDELAREEPRLRAAGPVR